MYELFEVHYKNCVFTVEAHIHGRTTREEMDLPSEVSLALYVQHGHYGDLIIATYWNFFDLFVEKEWDALADWVIEKSHKELELYANGIEDCFCQSDTLDLPDGMYIPGGNVLESLNKVNRQH